MINVSHHQTISSVKIYIFFSPVSHFLITRGLVIRKQFWFSTHYLINSYPRHPILFQENYISKSYIQVDFRRRRSKLSSNSPLLATQALFSLPITNTKTNISLGRRLQGHQTLIIILYLIKDYIQKISLWTSNSG